MVRVVMRHFEAYFERHSVTLLCILRAFFIGFSHFGNKIFHGFTQYPEKTEGKQTCFVVCSDFSFEIIN